MAEGSRVGRACRRQGSDRHVLGSTVGILRQELADYGGLGIGLASADDLDDALTCALEYEGFSLVELQTDAALI